MQSCQHSRFYRNSPDFSLFSRLSGFCAFRASTSVWSGMLQSLEITHGSFRFSTLKSWQRGKNPRIFENSYKTAKKRILFNLITSFVSLFIFSFVINLSTYCCFLIAVSQMIWCPLHQCLCITRCMCNLGSCWIFAVIVFNLVKVNK